ncbi:hypothetical protein [Thiothrix sp.]|jgi:hypothetical protein|uniref:hypothetical protein n=1 Tax=Thiothrix sp. TaxID=1032 RepID=UPI00257C5A54|nr:hypothetical protein [Thiothrix sp.]
MAGRWIRPTRGTLAAITALVKNKPGRLLASIRDATVGNRRLWVEQVDGSLRGLAWLDEVSSGGGSGGGGSLVTAPTISGSTSAAAGASVTLTASASVSAFADTGTTIAKYTWTKPDATTVDGATLAITASATVGGTVTVKCRATDTLGNVSADKTFVLTTAANTGPSATGVTSNLPATVTRGSTYSVTFSGGTDSDGTIETRTASNPVGCTLSAASGSTVNVTINNNATSVSYDVRVTDNQGLQSTNSVTISRSGASIVQPSGSTGALPLGTSTVTIPAGVSSVSVSARGGAGTAAVAAVAGTTCPDDGRYYFAAGTYLGGPIGSAGVYYPDFYTVAGSTAPVSGCYWVNCNLSDGNGHYCWGGAATGGSAAVAGTAGSATTVSGAASATFAGSATGVAIAPAVTTQVLTLNPATSNTLTVVNNGSATLNW